MSRFIVIFLVCIGAAPFLPGLIESRLGASGNLHSASEIEDDDSGERTHRISLNRHGHYVADAYLNGRAVDMLVDTGATVTALPESVADDIGISLSPSDFKYAVGTANGTTYAARAVINGFRIGNIRLRNIDAMVLKDSSLSGPLLGMSVLNQLKRFDISSGTLVLVQ
ncbi:MAG: TIGR02281 family clan AA aspartic protease [Pseudomonadota bacterium]